MWEKTPDTVSAIDGKNCRVRDSMSEKWGEINKKNQTNQLGGKQWLTVNYGNKSKSIQHTNHFISQYPVDVA